MSDTVKLTKDQLTEHVRAHERLIEERGLPTVRCWGWGAKAIDRAQDGQRCHNCDRPVKVVNVMHNGDQLCASCAFQSEEHRTTCLVWDLVVEELDVLP